MHYAKKRGMQVLTAIGGVVRCRWAQAAGAMVLAGTAALAGAVPAAASPANLVDCSANHSALQPAIDAAAKGETLLVSGTCTGPFTISNDLTLDGIGQAVLDGNAAGRTVTVGSGALVRLDHLMITNGTGGINNQGTLTVAGSTVSGNTASNGPGGGINNSVNATLLVTVSTVRDNFSLGAGGGINNNGSLTVRDSRVFGNSADNCGGIDSVGIGNTAAVSQSSVNGNTARVADGGGICDGQGSELTLSGSSVYGNTAGFGAGLYNNDGTESVIRSTVERNTASNQGGGIFIVNGGTMTLSRSAVESNTADGGSGSGGGTYNAGGTVTLDQSWIRENNPDNCAPHGSVPGCFG
jgi:parallel beta-helix repeat protein